MHVTWAAPRRGVRRELGSGKSALGSSYGWDPDSIMGEERGPAQGAAIAHTLLCYLTLGFTTALQCLKPRRGVWEVACLVFWVLLLAPDTKHYLNGIPQMNHRM